MHVIIWKHNVTYKSDGKEVIEIVRTLESVTLQSEKAERAFEVCLGLGERTEDVILKSI